MAERIKKKRKAHVDTNYCVACGVCENTCPIEAIHVIKGCFAMVSDKCIGCAKCAKACPVSAISIREEVIKYEE